MVTETMTGRDLAAALAELLGVPAESVVFDDQAAWHTGGECYARLGRYVGVDPRLRVCLTIDDAHGVGATPREARENIIARLDAATARVRAALGAEADHAEAMRAAAVAACEAEAEHHERMAREHHAAGRQHAARDAEERGLASARCADRVRDLPAPPRRAPRD